MGEEGWGGGEGGGGGWGGGEEKCNHYTVESLASMLVIRVQGHTRQYCSVKGEIDI